VHATKNLRRYSGDSFLVMTVLVTAFLSALLCIGYVYVARRGNILDHPNARSSHAESTPHGGGLPLYLAFAVGVGYAVTNGSLDHRHYVLLTVSSLLLVAVGIMDDIRDLSVKFRLSLYSGVVILVVTALLWDVVLPIFPMGVGLLALTCMVILWLLNLYNFMDGIDGMAALQAVLACGAAAFLSRDEQYSLFCLLLAGAQIGFLLLNAPPARLFMGDAGSIPTGFLLGALAILGGVNGAVDPLSWVVLLAVFVTDATWTLIWRMSTGQAFTQAHRLHAYQRLSRYWGSHIKVDGVLLFILCFWLIPIAWLVNRQSDYDPILVIMAYLPLFFGMAKVRALT
jgi:Fuc2NAc and GlcNAc transferase